MKKIKFSKMLAVLAVSGLFFWSTLTAQITQAEEQYPNVLQEENGNPIHSINDEAMPAGSPWNFMDGNGNGVCDHSKHGQGTLQKMNHGRDNHQQFVDEDGDGINDHSVGSNMHSNGSNLYNSEMNAGSGTCGRSVNHNGYIPKVMNHK
ncbi:MAG: hypothetical protein KDE52_13345 [Calditrichaeota bacterium]|nr:hypothetical protein [Calditrichota bacterium]MCB0266662.1 hypothetical protein [Calditrichota bacterium]MCB0301034.1 hypothetical protein [Calditrichota bacterium]MCB9067234.1 hypothetical protein [Calditrichia bacterium]